MRDTVLYPSKRARLQADAQVFDEASDLHDRGEHAAAESLLRRNERLREHAGAIIAAFAALGGSESPQDETPVLDEASEPRRTWGASEALLRRLPESDGTPFGDWLARLEAEEAEAEEGGEEIPF